MQSFVKLAKVCSYALRSIQVRGSLGRQHGRKEDLSGAKSKKDDKPKPKPKDKDTAPSSEGAAP